MKKFISFLIFFTLSLTILFFGCKNSSKENSSNNEIAIENEEYSETPIEKEEYPDTTENIDIEELAKDELM